MKITLATEKAKKEIAETIRYTEEKYGLPHCITEGILAEILVEKKSQTMERLIADCEEIEMMLGKENDDLKEELEKAKAAAKRTLKTEPDAEQEEGDNNGNGTDN